MEYVAVVDPSRATSVLDWIGMQACGACARRIGAEQPFVEEYLLDQHVEAVEVPAGGWIEPGPGACLVDAFHADCYAMLVPSAGFDGGGARYVGRCPLSKHTISAPRPLSQCPICGSPIELAATLAPSPICGSPIALAATSAPRSRLA
jgi:hypothetical protein